MPCDESFILMVPGNHGRLLCKVDLKFRKTTVRKLMEHSNAPRAWGRCGKTRETGHRVLCDGSSSHRPSWLLRGEKAHSMLLGLPIFQEKSEIETF